jgi:hypothetical protein
VALDPSAKQAANLLICAEKAHAEAYGSGLLVEWKGLATHSPFKERTGAVDHSMVANARYEAGLDGFGEIYGGRENIPSDIEAMVKSHSLVDTVRRAERRDERKRKMSTEEYTAERDHQKQQKKARRDNMSPEEEQEFTGHNSGYARTWRQNKKEQMTEEDVVDDKAVDARKQRKCKIMKLFNGGKLTQEQLYDIKANDWKRNRGNASIAKRKA